MEYIFITTENQMYKQVIDLRYNIFFRPYNFGLDKVYDSLEKEATHLVCAHGSEVLGYGRLTFEDDENAVVSQLVVKENFQRQGIGKGILNYLMSFSQEKGYKKIILSAKVEAKGFYEKLGFVSEGDEFPSKKTGLPHIKMVKSL